MGKKIFRFKSGKDANEMLKKKLMRNFILHGKLTTTQQKAKKLRSEIERLITYAKKKTESSKNMLLSELGDPKIRDLLISNIAPVFEAVKSGYVKFIRLGKRTSDGAPILRLEWSLPVVLDEKKQKKTKAKTKT